MEGTYEGWLASRPDEIREILRRFPPMTRIVFPDGDATFVIGASECDVGPPALILTKINPQRDYQRAFDESFYVHQECLDGTMVFKSKFDGSRWCIADD